MAFQCAKLFIFHMLVAVNIKDALQCPSEVSDQKALYKSGEVLEKAQPITISTIKSKLKKIGIFDVDDPKLTEMERKELSKLFDAIEIMITSRARQPFNVQTMFASLRLVERAVKKQLKEHQISENLAAKFHWEKMRYFEVSRVYAEDLMLACLQNLHTCFAPPQNILKRCWTDQVNGNI